MSCSSYDESDASVESKPYLGIWSRLVVINSHGQSISPVTYLRGVRPPVGEALSAVACPEDFMGTSRAGVRDWSISLEEIAIRESCH